MIYKVTGAVFSDLGLASSFMALDWVQQALQQSLGYRPFAATLNLRPSMAQDALTWALVKQQLKGIELRSTSEGFCSAELYPVDITRTIATSHRAVRGAVLVPAVADYPKDKIEVVAPVRLKDQFSVLDGDQLTLEFVQ